MIESIASEISAYWQILWVLLETPFNSSTLIWGVVPLYFGWIMNELASDKRSFRTAIQSGCMFIWAGLHWSQIYFKKGGGLSLVFRDGLPTINVIITLLVLIIGITGFISGISKRYPKYCSLLGHARFTNYFMICIFAMQANYLAWTRDRLVAIIIFALPVWFILYFIFKPVRWRVR
jgi:hypothetical protein